MFHVAPFRRMVIFMALTVILAAQTATVASFAVFTGDAATHQIATSGSARWVQIIVPTGNGAVVRVGDSLTSATRGLPLASGSGMMYPPLPVDTRNSNQAVLYKLSTLYYYAANGDVFNVVIGQ